MAKYKVYASQLVFYEKIVEADNEDDANEIAWESKDTEWEECHWGDWAIETENTIKVED